MVLLRAVIDLYAGLYPILWYCIAGVRRWLVSS